MFRWLRNWKREQPRLYVLETPYFTMFNIEEKNLAMARFHRRDSTYPWSIRPMTDEQMRKHAD